MTTSVLLVDDQAMVRAGFRMILESEAGIAVVGEAENGADAIHRCRELRPDVVLMDIQMPVLDGIAATREIISHDSSIRILVLTTFERDEYIFDALRAGASGFLLKSATPESLIDAVKVVAGGDALLAPTVTRRLIEEFARQPAAGQPAAIVAQLTEREQEVLALIARGMTNAEIAEHLFVGEATVKSHVSSLLGKLALRDRVQAVVFAYETGIVRAGDQI